MRCYISRRLIHLRSREVPPIDGYATWYDATGDCYRAARSTPPPAEAINAGCLTTFYARSVEMLKQVCSMNEFFIARCASQSGEAE